MDLKHVQLSDSLGDLTRIGLVFLKQIENGPTSAQLRRELEGLAAELRATIGDRRLSELESVRRVRRLYHLVGIDPTKDRPSPEKLLRRVVRDRPLPRINNLVDAVSLASLRCQCPIGVHDWDKVIPPVLVRIGRPDEGFQGVSNARLPPRDNPDAEPTSSWIRMHGRLVLVDGEGLFGSPGHDSERTSVDEKTVRAVAIAWAPADEPRDFLESVLEELKQVCQEYCGAKVAAAGIL